MKTIIFLILSLLELPFIILTWVDYFWNLLCKTLASMLFIFAIPAILTMPITWINGFILASIIFLKYNIIGVNLSFRDAIEKNLSRFPEL